LTTTALGGQRSCYATVAITKQLLYILHIWGEKNPERIEPNFLAVDVRDVMTCFKFGDDRFRGLGSAEGQSLPFPIDFDGRPYNTLTLPCERVIGSPR